MGSPRASWSAPLAVAVAIAFAVVRAESAYPQTVPAQPFAALRHGLRPSLSTPGEALPRWSLAERMQYYKVPGVAIGIVRNGELAEAVGFGVREAGTYDKVDGDTLFSVGSISKVATAATALRLVARGQLDLDRNVDAYLRRWKLPARGDRQWGVTLRMLMSHTSGLSVHGFADYQPGEAMPTLLQVLEGSGPAKNDPVRFKHPAGLLNDYSGGGVTVEQMIIEDVTGQPLAALARAELFEPLGMRRSTFESPLSAELGNIAKAHDAEGRPTARPRGWESFAEAGASGLWTSASDLARFVAGLIQSYQGRASFLPQSLAVAMMTEVSPSVFGLGPRLGGMGIGRYFFHMGANESYLAFMEGYPETGDGFVILTNGSNGVPLVLEIRNALADAIGLGAHAELRSVTPASTPSRDLEGTYHLDPGVPLDLRRGLTDVFESDSFTVSVDGNNVRLRLGGQPDTTTLIPLGSGKFAQPGLYTIVFDFQRDARGRQRGIVVSIPETNSIAYYPRE